MALPFFKMNVMPNHRLVLIDPKELRPHERISVIRAIRILLKILWDGAFTDPVLIDEGSKTILDGHHRRFIAKFLGLKKIPCWSVDYLVDTSVELFPRRKNISVDKQSVIQHAQSGKLYPRKTTRHSYEAPAAPIFPLRRLKKEI